MISAPHKLCVAPMMERTDRHCRFLLRLFSPNAWLYTEMITAEALARGDRGQLLRFHPSEHPVALQLGGGDVELLAKAARWGATAGYDEINLNVGCPSDRVQAGEFGAALMAMPKKVAAAVIAINEVVDVPVTVKTRLGIDKQDSHIFLKKFVAIVSKAGCRSIMIHARKAWLNGLSPKENREIPPLDYQRVYEIKDEFPELEIVINGGLDTLSKCLAQLTLVDGVMLGRCVYHNPSFLGKLDARIFGDDDLNSSPDDVFQAFLDYMADEMGRGTPLRAMARHLMGLYFGQPGVKRWRRFLGELPNDTKGLKALSQFRGKDFFLTSPKEK